jgi:hypothetical protein
MFAILAAIVFVLELLFQLISRPSGTVFTEPFLLFLGLFFVALHLAGYATTYHRRFARRR